MSAINNNNRDEDINSPPTATIDNNQQAPYLLDGEIDFEIVGLFSNSNGRFCCSHRVCGKHVGHGDVLRLVKTVVNVGVTAEEAIKLVKIIDGTDGCTIGFIPRVQSRMPKIIADINKFCIVQELYESSSSNYKRKKGEKNHGMASAILLRSIPINE